MIKIASFCAAAFAVTTANSGIASELTPGYQYTLYIKSVHVSDNGEGWGRGKSGEFRIFTSEDRNVGRNVITFKRKFRKGHYTVNHVAGSAWTPEHRLTIYVRTGEADNAPIDRWYELTDRNADCYSEHVFHIRFATSPTRTLRVAFGAGNFAEIEIRADRQTRPKSTLPRIEVPPRKKPKPSRQRVERPVVQYYYFKLTNRQSRVLPCYVVSVAAASKEEARRLAHSQAANYSITTITAAEYFDPNACKQ